MLMFDSIQEGGKLITKDVPIHDSDEHIVRERLKMSNGIGNDRLLLSDAGRQQW
jgi:hypothetical protein